MQPKKRVPRVERYEDPAVHEDANQHLWAVSYSDFLMVLLSFFVLFFSVDSPTRSSVVLQIADQFKGSTPAGSVSKSSTDKSTPAGLGGSYGRIPANLADSFSELHVQVEKDNEALVVNFPNDFFLPGEHIIEPSHRLMITQFLAKVKPFESKVNLYFEGHTDNSPLKKHKNDIIVDNYVLSSLRANSALSMARVLGFSEKNLFIQANSSNVRNSRSLSIRIEPKQLETL